MKTQLQAEVNEIKTLIKENNHMLKLNPACSQDPQFVENCAKIQALLCGTNKYNVSIN